MLVFAQTKSGGTAHSWTYPSDCTFANDTPESEKTGVFRVLALLCLGLKSVHLMTGLTATPRHCQASLCWNRKKTQGGLDRLRKRAATRTACACHCSPDVLGYCSVTTVLLSDVLVASNNMRRFYEPLGACYMVRQYLHRCFFEPLLVLVFSPACGPRAGPTRHADHIA